MVVIIIVARRLQFVSLVYYAHVSKTMRYVDFQNYRRLVQKKNTF